MRKIKLILLFCAVFLSILLLTGDKDRIQADDDDSNFTNLVVFARFAGETEFINDVYEGSSVRKITDNSYNAGSYSVGDYYRCVSDNKLRMRSVYLYDNGGSIVLSHPRGYYAEYSDINTIGYKDASERANRMYELRQEWSEAVNNAISSGNKISDYNDTVYYDYGVLDKDNNGTIDSITIIYKNNESGNISVSWSSPLWNYTDYVNNISVNTGKKTINSYKYVQITNSYCKPDGDTNGYLFKDGDDQVFVSIATAVHEMGHIMGLKDLYNSKNASPVYFMSVMAKQGLVDIEQTEEAMQKIMDQYAGGISTDYQYNEARLELADEKIKFLEQSIDNLAAQDADDLLRIYEIRERLTVCRSVIAHLKARKETRWHSFAENMDYPAKSDDWLKYVNSRKENGEIKIIIRDLVRGGDSYEHSDK